MRLMLSFFSAYKLQTALMLTALLLSGMAEGIGLSALLPLVNVALGADATAGLTGGMVSAEQNDFERFFLETLQSMNIAPTLQNLLLIMVMGVAFKSALLLIAQRQVGYTAAQVGTDLRLEMLRAVLRSKWEYFLHQPVGKLTNSLATEAQRSSASFVYGATALTYFIQAVIYGGVALALSWQATLTATLAGAVVIGVSHFLVRITRKAGKKQTNLLTSLMSNLTDTLQSVKPLKAMSREHLADNVLAGDTSRLNKALRRQVLSGAVLDSAQELMFAVFIALGILVALQGFDMPLPTVMVLVVAIGRAFAFLGKVQKQFQKMAQGESAYWAMRASIDEALGAEEQLSDGIVPNFDHAMEFRAVDFDYDQHPVFRQLSLTIRAGTLTTLVGPSGAGKTTIIDLTIGLLRPQQGQILLDGTPLSDIDIRAWRSKIGYVPQETVLLHDTIAHNVSLGDPDLDPEAIQRALESAGAWDFVQKMPEGVETNVGERGGKLSGGQRQRIVIARALVNRPRLLILDEATSALDPASEAAIRQTMETLKGELTILAISHNRAMVDAADTVYKLGDGQANVVDRETEAALFS
ncbi:ABC transporter ATP-binding protein [Halieaceae bacterium IMCC14734]|uniref:ABC transporter ATP-binding protein n=1 Tax=Candidatus Litorirhabdus singularis TaxID=2518993 RepID=A0ABT3TJG5_9GAMM|nr:ABC transporter ATP-binding protein [Candidatus Litorirhabdus singularis]MCX2982431.1 ABC transporter ATP-binding protein [Candidatus Litorirhabdus singularis]